MIPLRKNVVDVKVSPSAANGEMKTLASHSSDCLGLETGRIVFASTSHVNRLFVLQLHDALDPQSQPQIDPASISCQQSHSSLGQYLLLAEQCASFASGSVVQTAAELCFSFVAIADADAV